MAGESGIISLDPVRTAVVSVYYKFIIIDLLQIETWIDTKIGTRKYEYPGFDQGSFAKFGLRV